MYRSLFSTYSHNSANGGSVTDHAGVIYTWQKCVIENYGTVFDGNYAKGMGGVIYVEEDSTVLNYQVPSIFYYTAPCFCCPFFYWHNIESYSDVKQ